MTKNTRIVGLLTAGFMLSASGALATSPVATPSDQIEPAHTAATAEENPSQEKVQKEAPAPKKEGEEKKKKHKQKKHDHNLSREARNAAKSN